MKNIYKQTNMGSFATTKLQVKKLSLLAIALVAVIGFSFTACDDPQPVVPAAPTGLTATASSSSRIDISWNSVSGASGYM